MPPRSEGRKMARVSMLRQHTASLFVGHQKMPRAVPRRIVSLLQCQGGLHVSPPLPSVVTVPVPRVADRYMLPLEKALQD